MTIKQNSLFEITDEDRVQADEQLLDLQRTIDFDTKEFTVEILVHKYNNNDLIIPNYQRKFVWSLRHRCRFIESVLLGLPIPYLFGAETQGTGQIEIVDGAQRIYTLVSFVTKGMELQGLDKVTFLNDFGYRDLSESQQRRFKNRTLRMVVLSERVDINTRFDIFERINTGSMRLEPSELRKGAFPGPFYDFVQECSNDPLFKALCPISTGLKNRLEDEELILRFFCYADEYKIFKHDVGRFLNEYLVKKNKEVDEKDIERKRSDFKEVLEFVDRYYPNGFAKMKKASTTPRVRFEAIAVGTLLALREEPNLVPKNLDWLESKEFKKQTTTHASNSAPRLRARIEFVRDKLLEA